MIDKQTILDSMLKELTVITHLCGKIRPGTENWRPSPDQRSVLELLRYLSYCAVSPLKAAITGDWETGKRYFEAAGKLTMADFPRAIDSEARELKGLFTEMLSGDLMHKQVTRPGTDAMPLGRFLLDSAFKYLPAYKMQLFLYLKQQGVPGLTSANVWRGHDAPPKA